MKTMPSMALWKLVNLGTGEQTEFLWYLEGGLGNNM